MSQMKITIVVAAIALLLNQTCAQSPLITIGEPRYEIGAKLFEVESQIEVIGKFDSLGFQYFFRNQYALNGSLESSTSVLIPFDQGLFTITEIIKDSLSNYYCIGTVYSDTTIDFQIGIAKFDETFTLIDTYNLGQVAVSELTYDVIVNSKGNIVIGGYASNLDKAFLYEYNLNGETIHEVVFEEDTTWLGTLGIIEDTSNSRYICSQTKFSLSIINSETFEIVDENSGNIKDSSYLIRYLYNLPSTDDFITSYIQYSSFETPFTNYYISRLSSDLDTSWTLDYGDVASDILCFPQSLSVCNEDNIWLAYITCNNCGNFLYENTSHTIGIKKLNSSGLITGEYSINGAFNYGYLSTEPASDNGVYILASLYNWEEPENDLDIVVFKLDSLGNLITNTLENEFVSNQINVYPNPTKDILHFQSLKLNSDYLIEIYKIDGSIAIKGTGKHEQTSIDVSQLASGMYIYHITKNGLTIQTGKFIKR